ncbi:MAG: hypothetical protein PHX08_09270 [Lachnospiraceae bacterium]|nr:hypothetical protein [Lachnospiraceae bacterium]
MTFYSLLVRNSVEETLNAMLDHEAEELVNAEKYERSGDRRGLKLPSAAKKIEDGIEETITYMDFPYQH